MSIKEPDSDTEILARRPTVLQWLRTSWVIGASWDKHMSMLHVYPFPTVRVSVHIPVRSTQTRAARWFHGKFVYFVALSMLVTGISFGFIMRVVTEISVPTRFPADDAGTPTAARHPIPDATYTESVATPSPSPSSSDPVAVTPPPAKVYVPSPSARSKRPTSDVSTPPNPYVSPGATADRF